VFPVSSRHVRDVFDAIQRRRTPRDAAPGDANAWTDIRCIFLARVPLKSRVASSRIPRRAISRAREAGALRAPSFRDARTETRGGGG
jgi:hypothetical protein